MSWKVWIISNHFQWQTFHRLSEQPLPVFVQFCSKTNKKNPHFLYAKRNFLYFSLFLLPLVLFLGTPPLTGVWLSFLYSPRKYLYTWVRSPWAFSASGLWISLCMTYASISIIFVALKRIYFSWTGGPIIGPNTHKRWVSSLMLNMGQGSPSSAC